MNKEMREKITSEIERIVPKKSSHSFGSIQYRPGKVTFATQNDEEKVYVLVRTHWIKNLGWIVNNIIYSLLPLIVLFVLNLLNISIEFISFNLYIIIVLAYYSIIFTNVVRSFYDWYFDTFIVTNERIVDYDFRPFRGYTVKEAGLDDIEDVEEKSSGLIASIFNFGDLITRTSSTAGELTFFAIAEPTKVRDILMDLALIVKDMRKDGDE
jgi:hypothetical protein